jgi:hypothetical protein
MAGESMPDADVRFYFDPVCPFAWMTSKWLRMVAAQRDYTVDWRFISLRMINSGIDYDIHFPAGYEEGHTSGLRLLRVAARARAEHGRAAVGPFHEAVSSEIFDSPGVAELTAAIRGSLAFTKPLLAKAGLPPDLADALADPRWDEEIQAEGEEALALTGRDVGTPIIWFGPPGGTAFFGPVISLWVPRTMPPGDIHGSRLRRGRAAGRGRCLGWRRRLAAGGAARPGSGRGVAGGDCRSPRTHAGRSSGDAGSRSESGPATHADSCRSSVP